MTAKDKKRASRPLKDDEHALWQGLTRSLVPLKRGTRVITQATGEQAEPEPSPPAAAPAKKIPVHAQPAPKPASPGLAPMTRRQRSRISRGSDLIEDRLDLHGKTQAQAHRALLNFFRKAQADGARTVLVITGKGARGEGDWTREERGVLKRQVPQWLRLPEFRAYVVGFSDAGIGHGGEGALYVQVRRPRKFKE